MIFVTVGTHEQPFDRLIQKVDALCADYSADELLTFEKMLRSLNRHIETKEETRP